MDDQPNNGGNKPSKGISTKTVLILGGLGLAALWLFSSSSHLPADATINDQDYDLLNSSPDSIPQLLSNDITPNYFTVPSGGWTEAERLALIERITSDYQVKIDAIAANFGAEPSFVTEGISVLLSIPDAAFSEKAISLYLEMQRIWSQRVASVCDSCMTAMADLFAASGEQINNATTCVATTFVANVDETSTYTSTEWSKVTTKNGGSSALFGLWKSKKANKTIESWKQEVRKEERSVVWVPHCTNWQADPVRIAAILANNSYFITVAYGMLRNVINQAPKPSDFVRPL